MHHHTGHLRIDHLSTSRVRHRHLLFRYQWEKKGVKSVSVPNLRQLIGWKHQRQDNQMVRREGPRVGRMLEVLTTYHDEELTSRHARVQNPSSSVPCNLSPLLSTFWTPMLPLFGHCSASSFPLQEASSPSVQTAEISTITACSGSPVEAGSTVKHEQERGAQLFI